MTGALAGGGRAELMDGNMNGSNTGENRIVRRSTSKAVIVRKSHDLVLHATAGGVPERCAQWWFDLRRQRLTVFGGLLRLIDRLVEKGRPEDEVQMISGWLRAYIADQYDSNPRNDGPPSERAKAA